MGDEARFTHNLDHNDKTQRTMNYLVAYLLLSDLICVSAITIGPRDTVLLTLGKGLFFTWLEEEKEEQHSAAAKDIMSAAPSGQVAAPTHPDNAAATPAVSRRWHGCCGGRPGRSRPVKNL